jgi:hypothetical protein
MANGRMPVSSWLASAHCCSGGRADPLMFLILSPCPFWPRTPLA